MYEVAIAALIITGIMVVLFFVTFFGNSPPSHEAMASQRESDSGQS